MVVFHDLNLLHDANIKQMKNSITSAAKLGYDAVAVGHQCMLVDKASPAPAPPPIDFSDQKESQKPIKQISRLTVVLSEASQTHILRSASVQSYDILAVQPKEAKVFQLACTSLEIDVISIDLTEKVPFYFKTHPVSCAIERGIYFEIPYAPAIKDSSVRRYIICNAMNLVRVCRGRNIIISSQTNKPLELRGPHDVANLGILFGMNENQAKDAVQRNCRAVVMHAATRKSIRSSMDMQEISELSKDDAWKVRASQQGSGFEVEEETMTSNQQQSSSRSKKRKKRKTSEGRKGGDKVIKTQR